MLPSIKEEAQIQQCQLGSAAPAYEESKATMGSFQTSPAILLTTQLELGRNGQPGEQEALF